VIQLTEKNTRRLIDGACTHLLILRDFPSGTP
jgi:hypothetical protein